MISPQLHPDSSTSCPPGPPAGSFNVSLEQTLPPPEQPRPAVATGADMESRTTTDAVVTGLWHCLLGSLAAGLGVSAVLGVLVLVLGQIG
jgi:hypothetical protein